MRSGVGGEIIESIGRRSHPLKPIPVEDVQPSLTKLPGVRAVVFDIYGTLLVSGVGDISLSKDAAGSRGDSEIGRLLSEHGLIPRATDGDIALAARFDGHIRMHQERTRQENRCDYPEVDIREVWKSLLQALMSEGVLVCEEHGGNADVLGDATIESLAVAYECAVNPVWPMPGVRETLGKLQRRGVAMGIVSNAQFYTPLMFPALLGADLEALGMDPELCVYSYENLLGKPDIRLYEIQEQALARKGLKPDECLYVGNDMLKDIWAAAQVGFKTALFAGDARSLRLRRDDTRCRDLEPDAVVTDLGQLTEVLA